MFHDFSPTNATDRRLVAQRPAGEEIESLLGRYPKISEIELARLIILYRSLPALDVALIVSDEVLGPKIDQFFNDHRSRVRIPLRQYAVLLAIGIVGTAILIWAVARGL